MSFIKDFIDGIKKTITQVDDPYKVKEVPLQQLVHCHILYREDSLLLYRTTDNAKFEIVVNKDDRHSKPYLTFSLLRLGSEEEAISTFQQLRKTVPVFMECSVDLVNRDTLQELCNACLGSPTWTLAHIAAHLGWVDCFKNAQVISQVNATCPETYVCPLHLAIKAQQLSVIQALMKLDVRMDIADTDSNTVFHFAAITTKDIIQALSSSSFTPVVINDQNIHGHAPLHLACLADKPDCVKELLRSGADVNITGTHNEFPIQCAVESSSPQCAKEIIDMYPNQLYAQDMKNGGTPLHWVKTSQCLEALIEFGCVIDAKNFQGDTALHVMVERNRFPCVVTLLSHGANVNVQGCDSNSPLHLAVKTGDQSLVHALIVFGADVNAPNDKAETPRHVISTSSLSNKEQILYALHAVGAGRCNPESSTDCNSGCSHDGDSVGSSPEKFSQVFKPSLYDELLGSASVASALANRGDEQSFRPYRVLCLDGGGIKGLVLIQSLWMLESFLKVPVMEHFDWIAGTSTGGILALALALGKSVSECRCLYFRLKDKVFVGSRPYDSEKLEEFLRKELGETTVMTDIEHPKVIVTGVLADRHPAELHLFRNYESPTSLLGWVDENATFQPTTLPAEQLIWRAARATGAAPTYFRPPGRFLDGGLIANNPTLDAITEIHQYNRAMETLGQGDQVQRIGVVLSLGTGRAPVVPVQAIDIFRPDSFWGAAKIAMGMSSLGQLLIDKVTEADGRVVDRAQAWCSMIGVPYFRLNPPLSETVNLDESDSKILVRTLWETMAYMHSRRDQVLQLTALLNL